MMAEGLDSQGLFVTDKQGMKQQDGEKGQGEIWERCWWASALPPSLLSWLLPARSGLPEDPGGPPAGRGVHRGADGALRERHPQFLPVLPAVGWVSYGQ